MKRVSTGSIEDVFRRGTINQARSYLVTDMNECRRNTYQGTLPLLFDPRVHDAELDCRRRSEELTSRVKQ
jgi:hypothetical protein